MRRHGWFRIERHDRIMVVRMFDAWNAETIGDYLRTTVEVMPTGRGGAWATVTDLRQWGLAGMEMLEPISDQIAGHTERGRTHAVFLLADHHDLLNGLIQRALGSGQEGVRTAFRKDDAEAIDFLASEGFGVSAYRRALEVEGDD